jgi:iron complex transport system ATP-binding protein
VKRDAVVVEHASFAPSRRAEVVLEDVDAAATAGRITVVVGANAAGKTTLLRSLAGLLPVPTGRVTIEIDGRPRMPWSLPVRRRAAHLAVLPQRVRLAAGFGVEESVAMGRHALPRRPERVAEAIERWALGDLRERSVDTLSVGQQQRVGLARTMAQHEAGGVLVLDEPFAPLDLRETARAVGVLRDAAAAGATVIASVHDLGLASRFGDDVWLLESGRLIASGAAGEVLVPERLEAIFGSDAIALAGLDLRGVRSSG